MTFIILKHFHPSKLYLFEVYLCICNGPYKILTEYFFIVYNPLSRKCQLENKFRHFNKPPAGLQALTVNYDVLID